MRIRYRVGGRFVRAEYKESSEPLSNPGCGWYHVYTFTAKPPADGRPVEEETWLDEECRREQLALVLIDIGAYRAKELPLEALAHIGEIFRFFRREGKQMILRFAYDIRGEARVREPSDFTLVRRHMEQLGGIICRYAADILVVQGILVGNWGEMHGSRFLDEVSLCTLTRIWYRSTRGRCHLAVRTPAQRRQIMGKEAEGSGMGDRLALFNDGIFGSSSDLGTYGEGAFEGEDAAGRRTPKEELRWQERQMDGVPNGGEALPGPERIGYRLAAETMRRMHLSYLNSIYHQERLNVWKNETVEEPGCWHGVSGYDYIGRHLGYRFVVRDVKRKGEQLRITVENCGFASLCEEADCCLVTQADGREIGCKAILTDARQWRSGQTVILRAGLPPGKNLGRRLRFFLRLSRRSDGRIIRFANQGAEEQVLLGEFREDTKVQGSKGTAVFFVE